MPSLITIRNSYITISYILNDILLGFSARKKNQETLVLNFCSSKKISIIPIACLYSGDFGSGPSLGSRTKVTRTVEVIANASLGNDSVFILLPSIKGICLVYSLLKFGPVGLRAMVGDMWKVFLQLFQFCSYGLDVPLQRRRNLCFQCYGRSKPNGMPTRKPDVVHRPSLLH